MFLPEILYRMAILMIKNTLFLLLILLLSGISFAQATPTTMTLYCPEPSAIKKDPQKLTWSANRNTFRSYDISFATSIDQFSGVQWVGAAVGQVTCVYKTFPKRSFPVLLVFHTLVLEPQGGAWSADLGGYKNCNSLDRTQCPFLIRLKPKTTDIYEEAEGLKSTAPVPPSE